VTSVATRAKMLFWMISTTAARRALSAVENPRATNTASISTASGCSREPKAMVFTSSCTAIGTTSDSRPMTAE
jgi:hypothetical protein